MPQGLSDGQKIRISHLGHCSDCVTSPAGDLLIQIQVKEHDILKRDKNDIISTLNITLSEAILGTTKPVLTLDGTKEIYIMPGTQNNQ